MHSTISLLESQPKNLQIYGCEHPASIAVFISLYKNKGPHIIQVPENLFNDLEQSFSFFNPYLKVHKLPSIDPWFPSQETTKMRIKWFYHALRASPRDIFLCSSKSLRQKTIPKEKFSIHHLTIQSSLPSIQLLNSLGYIASLQTEEEGLFSQRGAILDIFSPAHKHPVRLEALGDRIQSMRYFDPQTHLSSHPIFSMDLIPLHEIPFSAEFRLKVTKKLNSLSSLFHSDIHFYLEKLSKGLFFSEASLLIPFFYDRPGQALDFFQSQFQFWTFNETSQNFKNTSNNKEKSFYEFLNHQLFFNKIKSISSSIHLQSIIHENKNIWPFRILKKIPRHKFFNSFKPHSIFISSPSETQTQQIQFQLQKEGLTACIVSSKDRHWLKWKEEQCYNPKIVHLIPSFIPYHFKSPDSVFIKGDQWLGKTHTPSPTPFSSYFSKINAFRFSEITMNDPVVDKIHGVGLYRGLKTFTFDQKISEYIELEYKNSDKLYIPVFHLHRLFHFKSRLGIQAIDELGQPYWRHKLAKAKQSIQNLVLDLLKIYSTRSKIKRPPFKSPSKEFLQFEKNFPFEETTDQLNAIKDIFKDMSRSYPMDRLIIGDSGFGKTEVAMRAIFKAVEDGYQVAFLAPTTVLSLQHFKNFKNRFSKWPFHIELINRLISTLKIKKILTDLHQQKIDILIGSHRMLSPDVQFKNLGLIVIDEEHRFGVRQKEKLKKLKLNVDCIYMSATPIPRTLNMSLNGVKDISLIHTPPKNRLSPKIFIIPFQEEKIKIAILREINRGGQVLFIHNKIQSLKKIYNQLIHLFPNISIEMAHGQMEEKELEKNILDFFSHRCDLLLCTTIVETGMDFEKANTIIINDAHLLGLSQLYQLRGRVGRRAFMQSYCYFVMPEHIENSLSVERLNFLQTHNYLNSGYQIARYDLELRGGGEFLGSKQSGHLQNIGYDLYHEMLEENLNPEKKINFEPEIKLPWPAYIPHSYIPHDKLRLMYYKYLSDIHDITKIQNFEDELRDGFGPLPEEVKNLIGEMIIRYLCYQLKIKELKVIKNRLHLTWIHSSVNQTDHLLQTNKFPALNKKSTQNTSKQITFPEINSWVQVYDYLKQWNKQDFKK